MNTCIERFDLVKGKTMAQCEYQVVVYVDAEGRDLCESLDLPCYPSYPCGEPALGYGEGFNMCEEHDAFANHWD